MPPYSWSTPGRKPGTSTKVRTGTLNALEVRTKRAAFSLASMSRQPANCIGWLATIPTGWPSTRPKPVMMFGANRAWVSRNSASSRTCSIAVCMSYGWFAESGISVSSSRSSSVMARSASSGKAGASERLFEGR
ncbi:hypothetical protein SBADM41S_04041 [Streptomyces badius]